MLGRLLAGAGALVLAGILLWAYGSSRYKAGQADERASFAAQVASINAKHQAEIRRQIEQVRAIEREQAAISERIGHEAARDIAGWRALVERMRAEAGANAGTSGEAGLLSLPYAPVDLAGGSGEALVSFDDVRICGDNTVKAEAWREWYNKMAGNE